MQLRLLVGGSSIFRWASGAAMSFGCCALFGAPPSRMPAGIEEALKSGRSEEVWERGNAEAKKERHAEIRKLADKGNAPAQYMVGLFAQYATNYSMAIYWYLKAADQGHEPAQFRLAKIFSTAKWLRLAAEAGNTKAQRTLAALYDLGRGVPMDRTESKNWLRKAVLAGDEDAKREFQQSYGPTVLPDQQPR